MKNDKKENILKHDSYKLFVDDDPNKINLFLKTKYDHGLYEFAHCLADLLYHEHYLIDSSKVFTEVELPNKYFDDLIDKLKKLKNDTIRRLYAVYNSLGDLEFDIFFLPQKYKEPSNIIEESHCDKIKDHFKLEPYFKAINKSIEHIKKLKESTKTKGKGRTIRAKNIVALIWSFVMKKPDTKGTDWEKIASLVEWFYWNLKGTEYAVRLLPTSGKDLFPEEDLKREVLRLMKILKNNNYLKEKIDKLRRYYFCNEYEKSYLKQIDFRKKIKTDDIFASIGGYSTVEDEGVVEENKDGLEVYESPLIIFPNGKTFI